MDSINAKQSELTESKEVALHYMKTLVEVARESFLILDSNLRVISANPMFYQSFHVSLEQTENKLLYELGNGQWDIPELRRLLEKVLPEQKVMKDYDKNVPIESTARSSYLMVKMYLPKGVQEEDSFSFMNNDILKRIVTSDWNEVKTCFQGKAWKYIIIGCGSVLEGILLDCLLKDTGAAIDARKKANPDRKPGTDLLSWDLIDLVDAAKQLKIIGEASSLLGHALRLHRNLVHPGRQVKEIINVSEEEAQISFTTVEKCIKDLSLINKQK